jgi:thiol-disulfide isomerase/thioredoxin
LRRARRRGSVARMLRPILYMLLAACVAGPTERVAADTPGEVRVGEVLRDVTMAGLNGPPRKLSDFRGKPLVINVWASWCGPCRAEMASLERLAWREQSSYFNVIGISTDDYVDRAQTALNEQNATISHFIDAKQVLENMLGASHIPLTVLVDADGRILEKVSGARDWDSPASLSIIEAAFSGAKAATH